LDFKEEAEERKKGKGIGYPNRQKENSFYRLIFGTF
jgi:hypothetical protein